MLMFANFYIRYCHFPLKKVQIQNFILSLKSLSSQLKTESTGTNTILVFQDFHSNTPQTELLVPLFLQAESSGGRYEPAWCLQHLSWVSCWLSQHNGLVAFSYAHMFYYSYSKYINLMKSGPTLMVSDTLIISLKNLFNKSLCNYGFTIRI